MVRRFAGPVMRLLCKLFIGGRGKCFLPPQPPISWVARSCYHSSCNSDMNSLRDSPCSLQDLAAHDEMSSGSCRLSAATAAVGTSAVSQLQEIARRCCFHLCRAINQKLFQKAPLIAITLTVPIIVAVVVTTMFITITLAAFSIFLSIAPLLLC